MSTDAKAIYQTMLDRLSHAVLNSDLKTWLDGIAIPHQMVTCDGKLVLETRREVEISFADFAGALARLGVTRIERTCELARLSEPGRIEGFHTTSMYGEAGKCFPRFTGRWVLCQDPKEFWRVLKSENAVDANSKDETPYSDLTLFQREDTSAEQRLRRMVQTYFDKVDATLLYGNFEDWRRAFKLPFVIETRDEQRIVDTIEMMREDFRHYNAAFKINRVTDVTRVVRTAELIDEDLLIATFRAHVLSGPQYVVEPWNGACTMRRIDGQWYITKLLSALGPFNWREKPRDIDDIALPESGGADTKPTDAITASQGDQK